MPFIPHTPESLLARSDSKNPALTCRGLTLNGRPCRRAISKSPRPSPASSPQGFQSPEAYCWQHGDQSTHNTPTPSSRRKNNALKERTSVDTLVERLGLLEVEQKQGRKLRQDGSPGRVYNEKPLKRPSSSNNVQPLDHIERRPTKQKQSSSLLLLCCVREEEEGRRSAARPTKKVTRQTTISTPSQVRSKQKRPSIARDPFSQTGELLSLIPQSTSPQTTALLLSELAKPVSAHDTEGYIYIFWLTPESLPSDVPAEAAAELLAPAKRQSPGDRRISDVLSTFAAATPGTSSKKKALVKIGRAQNVQKRLNQWTRQCGYNVTLIRYYPYHPTTPATSNKDVPLITPRPVPNVNKVERLIHLELAEQKAKGNDKCATCRREHREWFEVEATRSGFEALDKLIRRWVEWGERDAARRV